MPDKLQKQKFNEVVAHKPNLDIFDIHTMDIVIHLSHNDLDGYGASFLFKEYFNGYTETINPLIQVNCNYGDIIDTLDKAGIEKATMVVITDLNLNEEEAKFLDNSGCEWMVYDHHKTGRKVQEQYPDNYHLDETRCGTQIIFDAIVNKILVESPNEHNEFFNTFWKFTDMVNTYDLWLQEYDMVLFNQGSFVANIIKRMPFKANELIFNFTDWFFFHVIEEFFEEGIVLDTFEKEYTENFVKFLNINHRDGNTPRDGYEYIFDRTLPINTKLSYMHSEFMDDFNVGECITKEGINCIIFSGISSIYQHAFDNYFKQYREETKNTALLHFTPKYGSVAIRSWDKVADKIAVKIFRDQEKTKSGGGHPNASGASFGKCFHGDDDKQTTLNFMKMLES